MLKIKRTAISIIFYPHTGALISTTNRKREENFFFAFWILANRWGPAETCLVRIQTQMCWPLSVLWPCYTLLFLPASISVFFNPPWLFCIRKLWRTRWRMRFRGSQNSICLLYGWNNKMFTTLDIENHWDKGREKEKAVKMLAVQWSE